MLEAARLLTQLISEHAVAGDQQIGGVVAPERIDQRMDALDRTSRRRRGSTAVRSRGPRPAQRAPVPSLAPGRKYGSFRIGGRSRAARAAMIVESLGERNRSMFVSSRSSRPVYRQSCGGRLYESVQLKAGRLLAELAVLLPEVVHRADEPVVVCRVEPDRVTAVAQDSRAEQRCRGGNGRRRNARSPKIRRAREPSGRGAR